jgi:hypothetical protein
MKSPTSCAGCLVGAAAQFKGTAFPLALEGHAVQRVDRPSAVLAVVLRRDAHHDAGVGVALVAAVLAHAVGDHAASFGRGGHHRATRAHAEAVDRLRRWPRGAPACSRPRPGWGGRRWRPKRARSITPCGCSMRKPTENGLASMNTPRCCSMAKVSRALWPSASTTWSVRSCFAAGQGQAAHLALVR